jgi:molybdopterin converting factor small subunit
LRASAQKRKRGDVTLFLYGNLADAIGREVELDLAPGATVGEARRALAEQYPQLAAILARGGFRGCIDDAIAGDDAMVPAEATLSFFPPLSGG